MLLVLVASYYSLVVSRGGSNRERASYDADVLNLRSWKQCRNNEKKNSKKGGLLNGLLPSSRWRPQTIGSNLNPEL